MKSRRRITWLVAALLFVAISAGSVWAQQEDLGIPYPQNASAQAGPGGQDPQDTQDPSGRVARLQYTSGEVSMQPGGVNDWVAAGLNRPLTTSDRVWTDKNSRAELNVGDGFLRMNSETSLTLSNVSDGTVQLELDQGVLEVTVRHLEKGEIYEVDTPNFAFTVMKTGVYRFDVHPSEDQSWVTVRSGYGEATGRGPAVRVNSGEQVRFSNGNSLQNSAANAPERDGFDDWAQVRDKRLANSISARYVSPGVIGYQDLDDNGTWQTAPTYGDVWVPSSMPVGWAPYRYGHWAWIAPWGWTWVDDASWGFAPFHYGRWVYWNDAWAWAPGPLGYWNPYYAPALVGWIGGPGFGIGFGFGDGWGVGLNFGWFPLGWGAPYYPRYCGWGRGGWYRGGGWVSNRYLRGVNITNTRINNFNNIANNYHNNNFAGANVNRNIPGAVTAAPKSAFTSGAAINKVGVAVPKSSIGSGQLMHTANVMPTRQSVLGGASPARSTPPASAANRNVVTHMTPAAGPARFNQSATTAAGANSANHNLNSARTSGAGASQNLGSAARNVPRPPSAGGTSNSGANSAARTNQGQMARSSAPSNPAVHSVPRPAAGNVNGSSATGSAQRGYAGTSNGQSMRASSVPRPPANYTYRAPGGSSQSAPNRAPSSTTPRGSAPATRQSAPSSHGSSGKSESRGSGLASSVSRPSAGYSYHAAPAYSASSAYGAGRASSSNYGGSSRGSYSSAPSYGSNRSYGSAPAYSAHNSAPHYSAPHSSGGGNRSSGGGYRGGGGGSAHSGGGGHSSGGGGHHG